MYRIKVKSLNLTYTLNDLPNAKIKSIFPQLKSLLHLSFKRYNPNSCISMMNLINSTSLSVKSLNSWEFPILTGHSTSQKFKNAPVANIFKIVLDQYDQKIDFFKEKLVHYHRQNWFKIIQTIGWSLNTCLLKIHA